MILTRTNLIGKNRTKMKNFLFGSISPNLSQDPKLLLELPVSCRIKAANSRNLRKRKVSLVHKSRLRSISLKKSKSRHMKAALRVPTARFTRRKSGIRILLRGISRILRIWRRREENVLDNSISQSRFQEGTTHFCRMITLLRRRGKRLAEVLFMGR